MKVRNMFVMGLLALGLIAGFNSCKKDPSIPGPKIKFSKGMGSTEDVKSWDGVSPVSVVVTVDPKTKLDKLKYSFKYDNTTSTEKDLKYMHVKEHDFYVGTITGVQVPADKGTLIVKALDKNGSETTAELPWTKAGNDDDNSGNTDTPATGWNGPARDGSFSHAQGVRNGGFNLMTGQSISIEKSKSDDLYIFHASNNDPTFRHAFTSNKTKGLSKEGNHTKFVLVPDTHPVDFEKLTVDEAMNFFNNGQPTETCEKVEVGYIYIAKLNNELYAIKITKIDDNDNVRSGGQGGKGSMYFKYYTK